MFNDKLKNNIELRKIDIFGWNIVYFVFLFNCKLFKCILLNKDICDLIMIKIKVLKICLYIVCEFGKIEIVDFIVNDFELKKFILCIDLFGWNVFYFVVKGGKLKILEDLFKIDGMEISCIIDDGKILLYIVCIYK